MQDEQLLVLYMEDIQLLTLCQNSEIIINTKVFCISYKNCQDMGEHAVKSLFCAYNSVFDIFITSV